MAQRIQWPSLRRWLEYLLAIVIGNAIYFFSLSPYLPPALRHHLYQVNWGVALDFVVCALVYGLIRLAARL